MYKVRRITKEADLREYYQGFNDSLKDSKGFFKPSEIPLDYLQSCEVYAFYDRDGNLVSGYTLGLKSPFRLVNFIPAKNHHKIKLPSGVDYQDCCEVTCLWKSKNCHPVFVSLMLWPHVFYKVLTSGKKLLLGLHYQGKGLDKHYTQLGPITLYQGEAVDNYPNARFFGYRRWQLAFGLVYLLTGETLRRSLKVILGTKKSRELSKVEQ
jgi:hypothetical protein